MNDAGSRQCCLLAKLIRDQINRAAPEEPGVSLPLLKGCPGWAGGTQRPTRKTRRVHQLQEPDPACVQLVGLCQNPRGFVCLHRLRVWPLHQKNTRTMAAKCSGGLGDRKV